MTKDFTFAPESLDSLFAELDLPDTLMFVSDLFGGKDAINLSGDVAL